MSVEVTEKKDWFSNKGTTLKLFEQLLLFIDKTTPLGKEITFLDEVHMDFLALTDFKNKGLIYMIPLLFTNIIKNYLNFAKCLISDN